MEIGGRIAKVALSWLGTPYRHQASRNQIGCDCLGLVLGVWREIYGMPPATPPVYSADWAEAGGTDRLMEAAEYFCIRQERAEPRRGDLLLFRWRPHLPAKHCAIALAADEIIHAYEGHAVLVSTLVPQWRRRIAGVFEFPKMDGAD